MAILKMIYIKESRNGNETQGLRNTLNRIFNPDTEEILSTGGSHCPFSGAEIAYKKMIQTKNFFNSQNGRQGYHFILSFKPEENVEPELCKKIAGEFIKSFLDDYEAVYAVHTDQKYMHAHIVFNSVSYSSGLKYRFSKDQWRKEIIPVVDSICKKYNLSGIDMPDPDEKKENIAFIFDLSESMTDHDYKYAYAELERFFFQNGFEHIQHSGYFSTYPMTEADVQRLIFSAVEKMPWLAKCVGNFNAVSIHGQWDLLDTIHESYKELFPEENDITKQFTNEKQENPVNVTRSKKI